MIRRAPKQRMNWADGHSGGTVSPRFLCEFCQRAKISKARRTAAAQRVKLRGDRPKARAPQSERPARHDRYLLPCWLHGVITRRFWNHHDPIDRPSVGDHAVFSSKSDRLRPGRQAGTRA